MPFSYYIWQISIWIIVVPIFIGFINIFNLDKRSKIIFYLVILAGSPQVLTVFFHHTKFLNQIYNVYSLIEFGLIYYFIGSQLQNKTSKRIALTIVIFFGMLVVWGITSHGINDRFFNEWVAAANIFYLTWILLYVLESLNNDKKLLDIKVPLFWYLCGLVLYTPCTGIVFSLYHYIDTSQNLFIKNLWIIQNIFNVLMYSFFAIGLYKTRSYRLYFKQNSMNY